MKEYRKTLRYGTALFEILEKGRIMFGTNGFSKTMQAIANDWNERTE
tara:strand:- start:1937 stop:2077 length:141 start_codon:yes stop_codon:yes gene_type:complete